MKVFRVLVKGGLALLLISSPALVRADLTNYNYGTLAGTTMIYSNISEYTGTDTLPLYGSPTVVGNSLIFNHMNFTSLATNGASDITDGQLNVDIVSDGGFGQYIDRIKIQEFGDTTLTGTGTSATRSSATIALTLTILAVDYLPFEDFFNQFYQTNKVFGTWTLPPPITGQPWNGSLTIDLTAYLQSIGNSGRATWVSISSDNVLTTESQIGTSAFIAKKAAGFSVTAETIPEPGTLSLLVLSGTLLLIGRFGRKS
jgi:hypothetical protein